MPDALVRGFAAALLAAACYGVGAILQTTAVKSAPPTRGVGLAMTLRLARQPLWLAGLGCEALGFGLEAYAFSTAPAALIAPVMASDVIIFAGLTRLVWGTPMAGRRLLAVVAVAGGVGLLAASFATGARLGNPATATQLVWLTVIGVIAAGFLTSIASRSSRAGRQAAAVLVLALASGISYGLATIATRQVGLTVSAGNPWTLLAGPAPYALALLSILGIATMQRGLQLRAVTMFPIVSALSAVVPVSVGTTLLGDTVPAGYWRGAFVAALGLIVLGLVLYQHEDEAVEAAVELHPGVDV